MKFMEKAKRFFTLNAANHEGFTLVELIVVIAILAILAGVAVPAYSGYIKRAEKAGDLQIVGAINEAFAAACMVQNLDAREINTASLAWTGNCVTGIASASSNKTVDAAKLNTDFLMFFAGNTTTEFKVLAGKLFFDNGVFGEMSDGASKLFDKFTSGTYTEQINAYKGSGFYNVGFDSLAGQIDNASGMMAELGASEDSSFYNLLNSEGNMQTMMSFFESEDEAIALGLQKMELLKKDPAYAGMSDDELNAIAMNQMLANTAVLTAAQNTAAVNDTFITNLANGSAIDALRATTDSGEATADTVAQAAFAYAMYTSYKTSKGEDVTGSVDLMDVYDTLESDDFKNVYMKSDKFTADKDGYLAAMKMVSDGAADANTGMATDILLNGFNSNELVSLMQGVIK